LRSRSLQEFRLFKRALDRDVTHVNFFLREHDLRVRSRRRARVRRCAVRHLGSTTNPIVIAIDLGAQALRTGTADNAADQDRYTSSIAARLERLDAPVWWSYRRFVRCAHALASRV